jgi:hypothetical protein
MAAGTDCGHGAGVRHAQSLASLKAPQEETGFNSSRLRKGWALDLPFKPDQRFVRQCSHGANMSNMTYGTGEV